MGQDNICKVQNTVLLYLEFKLANKNDWGTGNTIKAIKNQGQPKTFNGIDVKPSWNNAEYKNTIDIPKPCSNPQLVSGINKCRIRNLWNGIFQALK